MLELHKAGLTGSLIGATRLGLVLLGSIGLPACQLEEHASPLIGYWYVTEVNGEPTVGSLVEMRLPKLNPDTLQASEYELSIGCQDWGRLDRNRGVLVSDALHPGKPPQAQCDPHDAGRLDALRQMTHQGASLKIDPETLTALLTTASGRTARFNYMDMTPVD
jgi:hypothetical protein